MIGPVRRDLSRQRQAHRRAVIRRAGLGIVLVVVLVCIGAGVQLLRGVPAAEASVVLPTTVVVPGASAPLPWPSQGAASVEVEGVADLGGVNSSAMLPLASVTKLITALVVLKNHPLSIGESGPVITIGSGAVASYNQDLANQQSVVAVQAGEQLTEYQALEAMLIPSANNMAHILARWTAGSIAAFVTDMNAEAAALGLAHTHLAGPSGLNPGSAGSAADMVRLAQAVLANPVLAHIVSKPQVTLPVAGTVYNYDYALGHDGIIGIKTGSTGQAGGNFVFAAQHPFGGQTLTVIGAVLGAGGVKPLQSALDEGERLAAAVFPRVGRFTVLPAGRVVLRIKTAWGASATATTASPVTILAVPGETVHLRVFGVPALKPGKVRTGERLASVQVTAGPQTITVPAVASGPVSPASASYKLTRL